LKWRDVGTFRPSLVLLPRGGRANKKFECASANYATKFLIGKTQAQVKNKIGKAQAQIAQEKNKIGKEQAQIFSKM